MTGDQKDEMESVMATMSYSFEVGEPAVPLEHPRYSKYKNYGTEVQRQKKRRSEWLELQREGRSTKFEKSRLNSENHENVSTSSVEVNDTEMLEAKTDNAKPGSWRKAMRSEKAKITRNDLKGRLMYSEWLIDVPENFAQTWVMMPAPKGKRVIIVLEQKQCQLFNKAGQLLNSFAISSSFSSSVILDGFVNRSDVYIVDFITCGHFDLQACDFDCRRMLGKGFLDDNGVLTGANQPEKWKFKLLEPTVDCTTESMESFMSSQTPYELDGLMFYYKDGFYSSGITPLVGWLKPWMMPDILEVAINPAYMKDAKGTPQEFMNEFAKNHSTYGQAITKQELKARNKMEVTD